MDRDHTYSPVTPDMHAALSAIMRSDPDGGLVEPTEAMYAAHKEWAISTYGPDVWARYNGQPWEPGPEV
jgi:hypothetical protein